MPMWSLFWRASNSIAELESLQAIYEPLVWFSGALVFLGVVMEVIAERHTFKKEKRGHSVKKWGEYLLIFGLGGEIAFGIATTILSGLIIAKLHFATAKAEERTANLERETVLLQRQLIKQDRRANVLMDRKRHDLFTSRIKSLAGQKVDIRYCPHPDSEISFFSLALMGALTGAGWEMKQFSPALGCSPGLGLMLDPRAPLPTKSAAAVLQKTLFDIGLVHSPKAEFLLSAGRPPAPGETLLEPSSVDTILVAVGAHP